nr:hypothetical protein [Tanacetum cinerariifolium]
LDHLGKFDAKGDEGYFIGYSLSSKKDVVSQDVKKDVSSLRYIALPNWFHEAHLETSNDTIRNSDAQDDSQKEQDCNADVPERSGISNTTATSKVPSADQVEPVVSLTVESEIPTVSSPIPIVCLDISPKSSSGPRLITRGDFNQKEVRSLGNALTLSNRFEDTIRNTTNAVTLHEVQANLSNMETSIPVSPTPTFRIHKAPTKTLTLRRLTRRATRIAQSKALLPAADEPASLLRDDRQREAFPTISSLDTGQDMENIAKTSAMLHDSSPRVTSLDANESSMQQKIHELMKLCTSLQRQQSQMAAKIKDQGLEISGLKTRVKYLEDKERRRADKSIELGSNDTEEMVNVLISMEAVNILSSGGAAASVSPADVFPTAGVPTVSAIFTTSSVEQIDAQVAREMEEEFARENQRLSKHLARDLKIARIHTKEELKIMIEGLDRTNEVIAKHLSEYEQAEADLSVGEKIELIKQKEFYMSVLRSHAGWKTKHFRGMTFEQIKDRSIPVWKKFEDFVPMSSKEKSERVKRQGLKMDQGSSKRVKISEGVSEEERKGMMQRRSTSALDFGQGNF